MDNDKITIHANSSTECVEVLKYLYPEYTKHIQRMNGIEETHVHNTLDIDKILGDTEKHGVVELPHTSNISAPPINNPEEKKRLVFYKCEECGTINCSLIPSSQKTIECRDCAHTITLGKLVFGKYDCECGAYGRFFMQETVPEIKCKDCGKYHIMTYNEEADRYESYNDVDI